MMTIDSECSSCSGTGLYCGFAEPKGTAVVCLGCNGTGCKKILYNPFTGRKPKNGVHTVRLSRGSLLATGVGPAGNSISYQDFVAGKFPGR